MENKKRISILGSTGSIGCNAIEVIRSHRDQFSIEVLAARSNIDLIEQQVKEFSPKLVAMYDKKQASILSKRIPHVPVLAGMEGLIEAACFSSVDMVLSSITGAVGIKPTVAAIQSGKDIALANKEVLVAAGEYVMSLARENNVRILPVDSEHSAIFQALGSSPNKEISRLVLTASGGPFFSYSQQEKESITKKQALRHPTWSMGAKITIDSSTLMNKGLEVIEAYHLFGVAKEQIDVVIHPQSVIHSMVEFVDGSMLAQMSQPTMLVPIQYAFTYPRRIKGLIPPFDFTKYPKLEFLRLEHGAFPCLDLAFEAMRQGGSMPCYLNAANEVLVQRFLDDQIRWIDISKKLEKLCLSHQIEKNISLDTLLQVDACAREEALHV
jgi:1-deoxy-D-xylulose-5-phosphate reductoisomerase